MHWCRPVHEQGLPVPAPGPGEPRARLPLVRPRLLSPRCAPHLLLASIHTALYCTLYCTLSTVHKIQFTVFRSFRVRVHFYTVVIIHSNLSHWRNLYSQHIPNQKSQITNYLNNRSINRLSDFRFDVQFEVILCGEHSKIGFRRLIWSF